MCGCTETLDAGHDHTHGVLPVDERNPIILYEDGWSGDWIGEYAVLLANNGGPPLAGIITNTTKFWNDVNANAAGWNDLVMAARMSGLQNIPDVTPSTGAQLVRPADGQIDSTTPNHSAGAQLIVDLSNELSHPWRKVVVTAGTSLTDIADAYLVDHSVVDRVIVVAMVGSGANGAMVAPNGDMDPWADWIVASKFHQYFQVSAYYDQTGDVTSADIPHLPQNPLGDRIASKLPNIINVPMAADQVALLAQALPNFVQAFQPVSPDTTAAFDSKQGPPLVSDSSGTDLMVTQIAASQAAVRFREMLMLQPPATDASTPADGGTDGPGASP